MIIVIIVIALIIGFIVVETIMDWLFIGVYALAAMAILNNIISMVRRRDKAYLGSTILYLLMAIGTAVVQYIFF